MKYSLTLLVVFAFNVFAGLQDVPAIVIDNTTAKTSSGMTVGFIMNDDHPKWEVKQETTYSNNNGVISVRTSNGDNNEETMSVDFASQKELDNERHFTNSQINAVNNSIDGLFDYAAYEVDRVNQVNNRQDNQITENERTIYQTTQLSEANKAGVDQNRSSINSNSSRISSNADGINSNRKAIAGTNSRVDDLYYKYDELRDDMYSGVASAMAVGMLPQAPTGSYGFVAGVGTYGSKEALAVGFSASGEDVSLKLGATYDRKEVGAAASVGFWFK